MTDALSKSPKDIIITIKSTRSLLNRKVHNTTALVTHVNKLLSTPSGIDRTLSLLYYLCTLASPQLLRIASLLKRTNIRLLIPALLRHTALAPSNLTAASTRLKTAASRISDARMFLRLWGLFGIYEWGTKTLRAPPADSVEKWLVLSQVGVNAVFQVLENIAYLNMHGIIGVANKTSEGRLWIWSTRMWAAHILLEFLRLERTRSVRARKVVMGGRLEDDKEARESWRKAMVGNAVMAPLSWHWSTEKGLISDTTIGLFGGYASIVSFRDAWGNSKPVA